MASTKLYPPYIEGKIPAQAGNTLNIPFEMNRAVGKNDYQNIRAQIKTVSTSSDVAVITSSSVVNNVATFVFEDGKCPLKVGQFYKIQLAYIAQDETVGYYSTVRIFKYTEVPTLSIANLQNGIVNGTQPYYEGIYSNDDATEKEYTYKFDIYKNDDLIYSTGELTHNAENDTDKFNIPVSLSLGISYKIIYSVTTINNFTSSVSYYIMNRVLDEVGEPLHGQLVATVNADDGYVSIDYKTEDEKVCGRFRLLRFTNSLCEIIDSFIIDRTVNSQLHIYKDNTVQQGSVYRYALQQFDENVSAPKTYSNNVQVDFEDMYLSDKERQLKIRFDPKITSFKTVFLESKLDTIGGRFPMFFRNGRTAYKEFPISGLISIHMDNNQMFSQRETNDGIKTDLIAENTRQEREFKLEVLEWLNNGKPKLFRSSTEGNYIVRLMNVQLQPNDTLGRMIHSFSAQAYEIAECNFINLMERNLIPEIDDITSMTISQVELGLRQSFQITGGSKHLAAVGPVGTLLSIKYSNEKNALPVRIGPTMVYNSPLLDGVLVEVVGVADIPDNATVLIEYDTSIQSSYPIQVDGKKITGITYNETSRQFIGDMGGTTIIGDGINQLLADASSFNIMALTVTAKTISNESTGTVVPMDVGGNYYSRTGGTLNVTDESYKVHIQFAGQEETILDLGKHTIYENIQQQYPYTWKIDSFGNITLTCDMFDDGLFQPIKLTIGNMLYTNVYYSTASYTLEE